MSGSLAAVDRLRVALASPLASIGKAVRDARVAHIALHEAEDIIETLGATANLAIACEALQEASKAAEASLRSTLAEVMSDIGCTSFETDGHDVSLRSSPQGIVITDEAALPPTFMVAPPARPDRKAIASALKHGPVSGAALANKQPPIVAFKPRSAS